MKAIIDFEDEEVGVNPYHIFTKDLIASIRTSIINKEVDLIVSPNIGMSINLASFKEEYSFTEEQLHFLNDANDGFKISRIEIHKNYLDIWIN